jgi:hypothetical protein
MKSYAGIGSREISQVERQTIIDIAAFLRGKYTLYSGHANGSDQAFEQGAMDDSVSWLPFNGFCKEVPIHGKSYVVGSSAAGAQMTKMLYPRYAMLSKGAHAMMNRNYHQVCGKMPDYPKVSFVLCCATPAMRDEEEDSFFSAFGPVVLERIAKNNVNGGTGQATRIAAYLNIPVFNVRVDGWKNELMAFIERDIT